MRRYAAAGHPFLLLPLCYPLSMKIAILTTMRNDWITTNLLLREVDRVLELTAELEASIWLVDDGSTQRPSSWNALAPTKTETNVIELHGSHGRQRALSAALGFLICELEAGFDAFVIFNGNGEHKPADISALQEAAGQYPGSVIVAGRRRRTDGFLSYAGFVYRLFFRLSTGKVFTLNEFLYIPAAAAEALCHSRHAGNHLSAAIAKLDLPRVALPVSRNRGLSKSSTANLSSEFTQGLAALSVFRDFIFARAFICLGSLCAISGVAACAMLALKILGKSSVAPAVLALPVVSFFLFLPMAMITFMFCLSDFSLRELRHWTPALDCSTVIRSISRVKRAPYIVPENPAQAAGESISFPAQRNGDRQ